MKRITLLSAAPFEVEQTITKLKALNIEVEYHPVGIGPIQAAKNVHKLVPSLKSKDVIFIGTCGIFSSFKDISLVTAQSVAWLPVGERLGESSAIEDLYPRYELTPFKDQKIQKVDVLCSSNISLNGTLDPKYNPSAVVENLELYSLMPQLIENCQSFYTILAVTNSICSNARSQWKDNFERASEVTSHYLEQFFSSHKN